MRKIPPTKMKLRLATGPSVTVMEHVEGISYTLKEVHYDDDFIVLDLDDKLYVILGYRGSEVTSHKSAGIDEQSICLSPVHQTAI